MNISKQFMNGKWRTKWQVRLNNTSWLKTMLLPMAFRPVLSFFRICHLVRYFQSCTLLACALCVAAGLVSYVLRTCCRRGFISSIISRATKYVRLLRVCETAGGSGSRTAGSSSWWLCQSSSADSCHTDRHR